MEKERKSLVSWILSRPDGKMFLASLLFTVISLSSCIVVMEVRYERNVNKLQKCEHEKQQIIKDSKEEFLKFLIESNERSERTKDRLDSLLNYRK